jgi:hypothetical protein
MKTPKKFTTGVEPPLISFGFMAEKWLGMGRDEIKTEKEEKESTHVCSM